MVQANDVVNVLTFVDEWTRCIGSGFQKDSLYRHGKFDACSAQWADLKIAIKAKSAHDPEEATKILSETHYKKNLGSDLKASPTAGAIWELKEVPGWDEVIEEPVDVSAGSIAGDGAGGPATGGGIAGRMRKWWG